MLPQIRDRRGRFLLPAVATALTLIILLILGSLILVLVQLSGDLNSQQFALIVALVSVACVVAAITTAAIAITRKLGELKKALEDREIDDELADVRARHLRSMRS